MNPFHDPSNKTRAHLAYCQNIHAGETWAEHRKALHTYIPRVRHALACHAPFGIGMRIAAGAVHDLESPDEIAKLKEWMARENAYVFTINGFPYGPFHGTPVKQHVYRPDWTTPERLHYTQRLADILAELLPPAVDGSISTVPGAYEKDITDDAQVTQMASQLACCAAHLARIEAHSGRLLHIGLEPEPSCYMETTEQVVTFFNDTLLRAGRQELVRRMHCDAALAEEWIRRHIGVCLDTCHAALQFEKVETAMQRYDAEGIRLSKIQISAALETDHTPAGGTALRPFNEPVYLHQVRARDERGTLTRWTDLPEALSALERAPTGNPPDTIRVHFHVPLFWEGGEVLRSTLHSLPNTFWERLRQRAGIHLEIETYTFDVLPPSLAKDTLDTHIVREYQWVQERLNTPPPLVRF